MTESTQTPRDKHFDPKHMDVTTLLSCQSTSGAFPASPNYSQYPYSWLRDGSFIAYSLTRTGEFDAAAMFHEWVAGCIGRYRSDFENVIDRAERGEAHEVHDNEFPPIRFTTQGEWLQDGWSNFQLDGYGQWLWSMSEHYRLAGEPPSGKVRDAAQLAARYLAVMWQEPCYDAWEENRSQIHTATLASIHGGLKAVSKSLFPSFTATAEQVKQMIMDECVENGHFVKWIGNPVVDASLIWAGTPFEVVANDHPVMLTTIEEIERTLVTGGGVRRFVADTFYGGGEWIVLTSWLGWHYVRSGKLERARELVKWVEAQRDEEGYLPEQVPGQASVARFVDLWTERWGETAKPLLWSHAMTLILRCELEELNS